VSVAAEDLAGMVPGEERRVPIEIDGVPALVTARPSTDAVTIIRVVDPAGAGRNPS
jgi:hypothetical protein